MYEIMQSLGVKHSVVAKSSTKAEPRAMAHGICEGMWPKRLLNELRIPTDEEIDLKLLYEEQRILFTMIKTKHVKIYGHFIN